VSGVRDLLIFYFASVVICFGYLFARMSSFASDSTRMAAAQMLLDIDFTHPRFERLNDLILLRQTLDITIAQLQVCYLRTVGLLEAGLLPVVQIETSLVNLAVCFSCFLVFSCVCQFVHFSYRST